MASKNENIFTSAKISSSFGIWYLGLQIAFKSLKSIHTLTLLDLTTATRLLIHTVGLSTFAIMPFASISSIFCFESLL